MYVYIYTITLILYMIFIFCMPIWCNESILKMKVETYPQNETYVIMTSGNSSLGSSCRSWKPFVALSTSELLEIKEQLETSTTLFWLKNLNLLVSCLCLCVCTWKRTLDPRSTNWNLAKFPLTIRRSLIFETKILLIVKQRYFVVYSNLVERGIFYQFLLIVNHKDFLDFWLGTGHIDSSWASDCYLCPPLFGELLQGEITWSFVQFGGYGFWYKPRSNWPLLGESTT